MISVVNGYVCTSPCEAATARQGKDPSAPPGSPPGVDKQSGFAGQPATVFGGSLKDSADPSAITASNIMQPPRLDWIA
jgi:hypothetical protein